MNDYEQMKKHADYIICSVCGKTIKRPDDAKKSKPLICECGATICSQCGLAMYPSNDEIHFDIRMICFRPWWLCSFRDEKTFWEQKRVTDIIEMALQRWNVLPVIGLGLVTRQGMAEEIYSKIKDELR